MHAHDAVMYSVCTCTAKLNNVPRWARKDTSSSSNRCKRKSCYSSGCSCQARNNTGFAWIRFRSSVLPCVRPALQSVPGGGVKVRDRARTCSQHIRRCVHIYTLLSRCAQLLPGNSRRGQSSAIRSAPPPPTCQSSILRKSRCHRVTKKRGKSNKTE